jgi:hypothetical protein
MNSRVGSGGVYLAMLACVVNKKPTMERHLSMSVISMLSDSPCIWSLAKQQ